MDDKDLERLQDIECPMPSAEAQQNALAAGLRAFRVAQGGVEHAASATMEKNQKKFQGISDFLRLMGTIHQRVGSFIMKKQFIVSTAVASICAVTVMVHQQWWGGVTPTDVAGTPPAVQTNVPNLAFIPTPEAVSTSEQMPEAPLSVQPGDVIASDSQTTQLELTEVKATEIKIAEVKTTEPKITQPTVNAAKTNASEIAAVGEAPAVAVMAEPVAESASVASPSVTLPPAEQIASRDSGTSRETLAVKDAKAPDTLRLLADSTVAKRAQAESLGKIRGSAASVQRQMSEAHMVVRPHPLPRPYPVMPRPPTDQLHGDQFKSFDNNPLVLVQDNPVSTFSIDVDTSAYSYVRRSLNQGRLPQRDSVRVEELINYFNYDYAVPASAKQPFLPAVAIYPTPWNENTKLLHVGIKGHELINAEKKPSNLVFLIDVSGSMNQTDKLPLLTKAFRLLVNTLSETDRVAIVTYAGRAATVLPSTPVAKKAEIFAALEQLQAGGSTAGAQGIEQAYALANAKFMPEGVNRVILATDGDFNVGASSPEALTSLIAEKRKAGIYLSVLGFGQGNYHDAIMQSLAQAGNGNAAYIDSLSEAQKVLVDEASAILFPIANDVKIQIEFNPAQVAEYRLIGYETRTLRREDFNNDKVDAGDIGAGHTVTAIYEITPVGSQAQLNDPLRYQQDKPQAEASATTGRQNGQINEEYAFLKLRYKLPGESKSALLTLPLDRSIEQDALQKVTSDKRFAAAVAAFGQKLRGNSAVDGFTYAQIIALANGAKGEDLYGYRAEFIKLVRLAQSLRRD